MIDVHPAAAIFPLLEAGDLRELADDIRKHGLIEPIVMLDGKVLDGRNRLSACSIAGVSPRFVQWEGAGDPVDWVLSVNLRRRHLDTSQRAMVAARTLDYHRARAKERQQAAGGDRKSLSANLREPIQSNSDQRKAAEEAARTVNVSPRTVEHAAKVIEAGVPELVKAVEKGEIAVSAAAEASELPAEAQRRVVALVETGEAKTGAEAVREVKRPHVANNTGDNEWYTPPEFIAAARTVMGGIDLDPASSEIANETVGAFRIFTAADDGLVQAWGGRVWMNPPYEKGLVDKFAEKLRDEVRAGRVKQAVVLVNNATDTRWFATLCEVASMLCFPTGRIRFLKPDGERGAPLQGQAVLYIGDQREPFAGVFARFGTVAEVVDG